MAAFSATNWWSMRLLRIDLCFAIFAFMRYYCIAIGNSLPPSVCSPWLHFVGAYLVYEIKLNDNFLPLVVGIKSAHLIAYWGLSLKCNVIISVHHDDLEDGGFTAWTLVPLYYVFINCIGCEIVGTVGKHKENMDFIVSVCLRNRTLDRRLFYSVDCESRLKVRSH